MADHDLVIRNGVVVDGTGLPRRRADVAVDNGKITGRDGAEQKPDEVFKNMGATSIEEYSDLRANVTLLGRADLERLLGRRSRRFPR